MATTEAKIYKDEPHVVNKAVAFEPGGFKFIPGVFQYSGGVASLPGFAIERVRFRNPPTLDEGYDLIENHLKAIGRPTAAFCSLELRSPVPFTEDGFKAFNRKYVATLERWGLFKNEVNPVARVNVCPELNKPATTVVYAFSYTVPSKETELSFQIAGSAEEPEALPNPWEHIIAPGDTSPAGMEAKAKWVIKEMQLRLESLGADWSKADATDIYTVHNVSHLMGTEYVKCGAAKSGVTIHHVRPPVDNVDYEMAIRGVASQRFI